ncbi:acetyltransferase [Leptospira limi]|uniref:Acetyltransferase n=1 Tax=Leptospira limi TaxID=2950023 RepID=A0ABT3M022_9LEPT|nr:acetyltransferase [Leptospira limi]MCW7462977.1 acetyltransferase [Leptospira limi]
MHKKEILLIGAGGHAKSCIDVIEAEGKFQIVGLIGGESEKGKTVLNYDVIGDDSDLPSLGQKIRNAIVVIGQIKTFEIRKNIYLKLKSLGYNLPSIVSPLAYVSKYAKIGDGTMLLHHSIVNAGAIVGENCIINSRSLIEHDVKIEDHCHVSTSAVLNGHCQVGEGSFIGSGSILKEGVSIGSGCIVGMGSIVIKNVSDRETFVSRFA